MGMQVEMDGGSRGQVDRASGVAVACAFHAPLWLRGGVLQDN